MTRPEKPTTISVRLPKSTMRRLRKIARLADVTVEQAILVYLATDMVAGRAIKRTATSP